jgi:hypothetical protein
LSLLDDVGNVVSLYTQYETIFSGQNRFRSALTKVYMDIIGILLKAQTVFGKSGVFLVVLGAVTTY